MKQRPFPLEEYQGWCEGEWLDTYLIAEQMAANRELRARYDADMEEWYQEVQGEATDE